MRIIDDLQTRSEQVPEGGDSAIQTSACGAIVLNADDWGRDKATTDCILACAEAGGLSSVSAMVFMEDSERASDIARERRIDTGLHLNVDTPFTASHCPKSLLEHQKKIAGFVRYRLARPIFHPGLSRSFHYVVSAQLEEYERLYGVKPRRVDGHHHMHLCANVLIGRLLPDGIILRPHFSHEPGEKRLRNQFFRMYSKWMLSNRYQTVDYLFSLPPLEAVRLAKIISLAADSIVELETHPVNPSEFKLLTEGDLRRQLEPARIATSYLTRQN